MYNEEQFIIDDNLRQKVFTLLKNYKKADMSDMDALKFLKTLLVSAQDFSYKAYDDESANTINLYDFLAYTLIKHFNDKNDENNEDDIYLEILYMLFKEDVNIKISQSELMSIFDNLEKIKISDKLKEYIYDICYAKNVLRNFDFYYLNQNLNVDPLDNKYYIEKFSNLEKIINKYNVNFYNYDMTNKLNLNKTNLVSEFDENIENLIINNYENKGKMK